MSFLARSKDELVNFFFLIIPEDLDEGDTTVWFFSCQLEHCYPLLQAFLVFTSFELVNRQVNATEADLLIFPGH